VVLSLVATAINDDYVLYRNLIARRAELCTMNLLGTPTAPTF
jgi:hypothetical protein